jgi:hypothetical protein
VPKLGDKRETVNRTHVFIATPAYDGKVDAAFSQSIAEASFCAPLYQIHITASVMGNGAFIDLARNVFVKMFLEDFKECSHLFFIDADLKFPAQGFVMIAKANLPICAGVYRRREKNEDYPAVHMPHPEGGGLWVEDVDLPLAVVAEKLHTAKVQFLMHKRVPTGFLCIRRDVIEEMAKGALQMNIHGQKGPVPRLFYTKINEENRFVGEDYAFCDDYIAKYQRPIPVIADLDFVHGGYEGNYAKFLQERVSEEEKKEAA